jgi:hypothetical protein
LGGLGFRDVRTVSAPRFAITLARVIDSATNGLRRGPLGSRTDLRFPLARLCDSWITSSSPQFTLLRSVIPMLDISSGNS